MPLRVPGSHEEITPEWLQAALAGSPIEPPVGDIRTARIGLHYGLASELVRCTWRGRDGDVSVVVKIWPTDGPGGDREVLFYREFGSRSGVRVPVCHHGALDEAARRGVLVLEDLSKAVPGDFLEPLAADRAHALARSLAALHATWWHRNDLRNAAWIPPMNRVVHPGDWIESRRRDFLSRFPRVDPVLAEIAARAEALEERANERLAGVETTLLHGDLHADNVLFERETGVPVLVDWSRVARGPAALDLASLLFETARVEDRKSLTAAYREALAHAGVAVTESDLRRRIGGALIRRLISGTLGIARWEPAGERETKMIDVGQARLAHAAAAWTEEDPTFLS